MEKPIHQLYSSIDSYGWAAYLLNRFLSDNKGKEVVVEVNSPGGSVDQAIVMSRMLEKHGNVTVRFLGMCASAVTWMAFGAKNVEIYDDSFWMCHRSSITVDIYRSMNVEDIDKTIRQLQAQKKTAEAVDLMIIQKYHLRCQSKNKSVEQVIALMNEERFMTAAEAFEWGFVDRIVPSTKQSHVNAVTMIVQNCSAQNLPLPPTIDLDALKLDLDAEKEDGLLAKFLKSVTGAFRRPTENNTQEDSGTQEPEDSNTNSKPLTQMNKTFILVNALLAVAGFEVTDGKITLSEDQMQCLENALAAAKAEKEAFDAAQQVLDGISENVKSMDGLKNKALAIKTILDRMPLASPAGAGTVPPAKTAEEVKQEKLDEAAVDPINQVARTLNV